MSTSARAMANAIRAGARRDRERHERPHGRATITSLDPLRLDLHNTDLVLDDHDVEFSQDVARYQASEGLEVGDVLVVLAVGEGDWVAITVLSDTTIRPITP